MDKLRILIVEDEPIISNDIKASLAKLGYEVCGRVASGASAVKSAEDLRPDLILMDIILQGDMNGIEAANIINKRFNIPIIYMTGNADMETIQSARDTNPYGYVLKPVNSMNLFSVIDTALRRHNLEKDLRDSEEKFRIISENIIDGIALTIDGICSWVNDAFACMFGYVKEEMIGRGADMVIHPDDFPKLMERMDDFLNQREPGFFQCRAIRRDRTEIVIEIKGSIVHIGPSAAILIIVRDITREIKIYEDVRLRTEELDRFFTLSLDMLCIADINGYLRRLNKSWETTLGYPLEEIEEKSFLDFVHPDDVKPTKEVMADLAAGKEVLNFVNRFRCKDGSYRWIEWRSSSFDGRLIYAAARDITGRRLSDLAIRESEDLLRSITTYFPGAVYQFYAMNSGKMGVSYVNERVMDLFGIETAPLDNFFERFASNIHPDDREGFIKSISEVVTSGINWDWEGRFINPRGNEMWIRGISYPMKMDDRVVFNGLMFDTTDKKIAELKMRESEERFRALILNLQESVLIMDREGRIIFENPAVERMMGYSMVGKNGFATIHPEDIDLITYDFGRVVKEEKRNQLKPTHFRVKHEDGSWLYLEALATNLLSNNTINGILVVCRDATARVTAQTALRESEERYRTLFDQSPVGVYIFDMNLTMVDCNEQFAHIVKIPRELLLNDNLNELPIESVVRNLKETINGNTIFWEGWMKLQASDEMVFHSVHYSPLRSAEGKVIGGIGVVQDMTERKRDEEKLVLSEERNRLLIEHASESITVIQNWRFVFSNPRFIKLTGYSARELRSRQFTEFIHQDDREMISGRFRKRMDDDSSAMSYEVRFTGHDGNLIWTELNSVLFHWEGKPASLCFIRDITERKLLEEDRKRIEVQLQQTQKLESLGILAGGIAHDFNNLLMVILGNIDLALMDSKLSSSSRENLQESAKASQRAADLCRQMLAYSGRGRFIIEHLSLNDIIREMEHMLEVSISKKAVQRFNLSQGIPYIMADATQLRQIIMNLLINASDSIGDKSGIISVSTGAMECDRSYLSETWLDDNLNEGMYVYFEVADTGSGMDHQTLSKIFDPFFTTKFTGRGLGLAAVLGIVRGHKGAIKVYSETGKGTTFKVLFPAAKIPLIRKEENRQSEVEWRGSGTVLLADDEDTIRALGRQMLERLGFTVLIASDGREALELFKNNPDVVCVILDLTMPHMDGEETFKEIRRIRKDARVIMSSGYNEQDVTQRFAGRKLTGFIQKPYQITDLAAKLRKILE